MPATAWALASRQLRPRRAALLGLGVVTALGVGTAIGAAVAAYRTDHAYPDYVRRAEVGEVVINPGVWSTAIDQAIRGFDGVESVHSHALLLASAADTTPMTLADASPVENWVQSVGSIDARYVDADRPTISSGRAPTGTREIFVGNGYRSTLEQIEGHRLQVGDTIDLAFWWNLLQDGGVAPDEVVAPIGVERVRIAGFGMLANEILPDELYPRQQLIVSADLAAKYSCLPTFTPDMTMDEARAATSPTTCSSQYWFYSLNLAPGVTASSIRDQFAAAAATLNETELPKVLRDAGSTHFYIGQDRSDLDSAVKQTTRPSVTALAVFALVATLATLTILGLMMARMVRRNADAQLDLLALGATRRQRAVWTALPLLITCAVGVVAAAGVALVLSPIGPLGTVRAVQPSPGFSLPGAVALPGVLVVAVAVAVLVAFVALGGSRTDTGARARHQRPTRVALLAARGNRPARATGISAAAGSHRAGADLAVLLGCVVAITGGVTAIVFGSSLSEMVSHPHAYGWPWDVSVITGGGYGYASTDAVDATLQRADVRGDIADVSYFAFDPATYLGERTAPVVYGFPNAADTDLPILAGRAARQVGEAVVGSDTSKSLGISIGDQLTARSDVFGDVPVRVVGIAVLPSAGQFVADRTGLGTGAFILVDGDPDESAAMVGLTLKRGVDPNAFVAKLGDLSAWDTLGPPIIHSSPVRTPEIIDVSDIRSAPTILGGILVLSLGAGLSLSIATSIRDRRRELAILRVLGFSDRELHASVRWQAGTILVLGAIVGVPLGMIAGRLAWQRFADELGVLHTSSVPIGWLTLYVLGTIALGLIAALPPSRAAARLAVVEVLHTT